MLVLHVPDGHPFTGARPVVTAPAWRASAERPVFPAGAEGRINEFITLIHFTRGKVTAPGRRHPPTESACVTDLNREFPLLHPLEGHRADAAGDVESLLSADAERLQGHGLAAADQRVGTQAHACGHFRGHAHVFAL